MMRQTITRTRQLLCATVLMAPLSVASLLGQQAGSTATPPAPSAQTPAGKPATPVKPASSVVTLIGCVEGTGGAGDPFRLSNPEEGIAYRLTGTNMHEFAGKRVQIAGGTDSKKLKIVGGLTPSANVAGQAGSLDPARTAVASDPLSTSGKSDPPLPEFRVRSVKPMTGSCDK